MMLLLRFLVKFFKPEYSEIKLDNLKLICLVVIPYNK